MGKKRELLFSVTAADCDWSYYVGPGNGGQKRQKTHSGVICKHRASGAQARCHEDRMQLRNKQAAFRKMTETEVFKKWHKIECARRTGALKDLESEVDRQMEIVRVEVQKDGKWVKYEEPDEQIDG